MPRSARLLFPLALLLCGAIAAPLRADDGPNDPAGEEPTPQPEVYLLIGQSNMAGRAPVAEADAGVVPRCFLLNAEDVWEPAQNPLNRHSTVRKDLCMQQLNPGYGFARRMLAEDAARTLGLVVNAKGGSSIEEWARGTRFYTEAIRRTRAAQKIGTLKGVLWHQGEANSRRPAEYLAKLQALVANLRADLHAPDLPFVAGQIYDGPVDDGPVDDGPVHQGEKGGGEPINAEIARLPQTTPHTAVASSAGLTVMDRWHFDAASMKTLGARYAEAMLTLHAAADAARGDDQAE